jgi:hypothetical protein
MRRPHEEGVFGGITGQMNDVEKSKPRPRAAAEALAGSFTRPDLAIPCWVAPLQSPTPFHQAKHSVAQVVDLGADSLPGPAFKIDTSAYRLGRSKTVTSAYRVAAQKQPKSTLNKSETLV